MATNESITQTTDAAETDEGIDGYNQYGVPYVDCGNVHSTFVQCLNGIAAEGGCNVIRAADTDVAQTVLMATDWEGGKAFLIADVRTVTTSVGEAIETMRGHTGDPNGSAARIRGLAGDGDVEFDHGWLCMRDERHGATEYIIAEVTAIEHGVPAAAARLTQRLTGATH